MAGLLICCSDPSDSATVKVAISLGDESFRYLES
jgi:hypothetical protein